MTDKQIIIDASKCEWRTGIEHCGNYECMLNKCCDFNCDWYRRRKFEQQLKAKEQECEELKDEVLHLRKEGNKSCAYCVDLIAKEQECEELDKELHKDFEEKNTLHLIIDRLLEASGYDTNTASSEDFEDVYEKMRYEQQQLDQLKATLQEIKEIAEWHTTKADSEDVQEDMKQILQKISEVENG